MKKSMKKAVVLAAMGGALLQFGGCFGGIFQALLQGAPVYVGLEFLTDNDGIFDLFAD